MPQVKEACYYCGEVSVQEIEGDTCPVTGVRNSIPLCNQKVCIIDFCIDFKISVGRTIEMMEKGDD